MPLPKPELGLVVHYAFVWAGDGRSPPPDAGKHRPCLIVDLETVQEAPSGRGVTRATYLPISLTAAREGEHAVLVPSRVAKHLGLTADRSFLYLTYAIEDDWPFDLAPRPGSAGRFDYGLIPPRLFAAVAKEFAAYLATRPRMVHRRDG